MPKQQKGTTPSLELCKVTVTATVVLWRVSAPTDNPRCAPACSWSFSSIWYPPVGVASSSLCLLLSGLPGCLSQLQIWFCICSWWLLPSSPLTLLLPQQQLLPQGVLALLPDQWTTLLYFSSLPLKCPELCCCWTCIHSVTTYTCLCILLGTVWYELFWAIKIRIKEPAFALTRLPRWAALSGNLLSLKPLYLVNLFFFVLLRFCLGCEIFCF